MGATARAWLISIVYFASVALLAWVPRHSGNVWSRYMTVESLVERRTLAIDGSPLLEPSGSPDVVRFGDQIYSDKPPLLSAAGALLYAPLAWGGIRFSGPPPQWVCVNWVLVTALVGVSSSLGLFWFRKLIEPLALPAWHADLLTLLLGFGTLVLPYSVTFNNHSVAAGLLTGAFYLAAVSPSPLKNQPDARARHNTPRNIAEKRSFLACASGWCGLFQRAAPGGRAVATAQHGDGAGAVSVWSRRGSIPPWRVACSGLLAGLAAVIDLPAGATMLIALSAWSVARGGSVMAFAAGAAPPLALHCVLQSLVTGSPLPAELYPEAFERAGRYWAQHPAAVGSRAWFAVELLLGPQGWLTVTPMLAFGLVELHRVMLRRGDPLRPAALLVAPVVALLVAYYAWGVRRTDFAGSSFGTRHLLAITPLCYFFAAVSLSRLRSVWWHLLFTALAIVSVLYAWEGTRNPWERIEQRLERGRERGRERVLAALQSFVIYPSSSYER